MPASARASVRRSSTSPVSIRISSTAAARCASSVGWTPSIIASSSPCRTASGVRSSWLTSASRVRRCRSSSSSRAAIALKAWTSDLQLARTAAVARHPSRVVAGLQASGRLDQIAEGKRETARAAGEPGDGDHQDHQDRGGQEPGARSGQAQRGQNLGDEDQRPHDDEAEDEEDADREADEEHPPHAPPRELALRRPRFLGRPPARPIAVPSPPWSVPLVATARVARAPVPRAPCAAVSGRPESPLGPSGRSPAGSAHSCSSAKR